MYDCLVVGAGVVGCATARELSRYRLSVAVLEKGSDVCSGASKGNSAMVHGGFDPDPGTKKAIFNVLGNAMYDELCRDLEVPFDRSGTMILATSAEEMKEVYSLKERGDQNGVPVQVLERDELKRRCPKIGDGVVGALWAPTGGIVCPYGLVIAMSENARQNGVEFYLNTKVTGIERTEGGYRLTTQDGRTFESKTVLNCAGTGSDVLNNLVSDEKVHITPRFGSHLILDRKYIDYVDATYTQTPTPLPGGGHTKGMGIMPSVDGTVILGCDAWDVEDPDDVGCTAESIDKIIDYFTVNWDNFPIARDVPAFPRDGIISAYGGLRAHCDSDDYIIGEASGAPGFYNAVGIESPGLTAGPAIGRYLAQLAATALNAAINEEFDPHRSAIKRFRDMTDEERIQAIAENPDYGKMVCRCEMVTEAEVREAIRRGATTVNAVKMRTRAGMGRCQGGFCGPRVVEILSEELGIDPLKVTLSGEGSNVLSSRVCDPSLIGGDKR